jgi:hypothetical protein
MPEAIQDGWNTRRFDQMAVIVNDRVDDPSKADVERYVGLEHLDADSLTIRRWGSRDDVAATKLRFRAGDIIFGRRRAYQRKLAVANFAGICSAHAMVLRARPEEVVPEFLPFFMQSDLFMNRAQQISVGSLSPTINWKTLAKEEFPLPPLQEQARIVGLLQNIDDAIESILRTVTATSTARKALARELFRVDILARTQTLGSLIRESRYGPRFSSALYDSHGAVAQLRTTDIDENGVINYQTIPCARLDPADFKDHLLRDGDLVISRSGTTGITALFRDHETPTIPAAFLIRLRTTDDLLPEYLHEYLSATQGRQVTASLSRGGVQKNINGSQLLAQPVPCPDPARQEFVVATLLAARGAEAAITSRTSNLRSVRSLSMGRLLGTRRIHDVI